MDNLQISELYDFQAWQSPIVIRWTDKYLKIINWATVTVLKIQDMAE